MPPSEQAFRELLDHLGRPDLSQGLYCSSRDFPPPQGLHLYHDPQPDPFDPLLPQLRQNCPCFGLSDHTLDAYRRLLSDHLITQVPRNKASQPSLDQNAAPFFHLLAELLPDGAATVDPLHGLGGQFPPEPPLVPALIVDTLPDQLQATNVFKRAYLSPVHPLSDFSRTTLGPQPFVTHLMCLEELCLVQVPQVDQCLAAVSGSKLAEILVIWRVWV